MLTSETDMIDRARIIRSIGKITAVSACRAVGRTIASSTWRERVLRDLVRRAEDIDADAIVHIDVRVEPAGCDDEIGIPLERVYAEGVAVSSPPDRSSKDRLDGASRCLGFVFARDFGVGK